MKKLFLTLVVAGSAAIFTGCGERSNDKTVAVDTKTPVAQLETEATKMDLDDLKAKVESYQKAITAKATELTKVEKEFKDLPLSEVIGEKADKLKAKVTSLGAEVKNLKDRLAVYENEIKKKTTPQ